MPWEYPETRKGDHVDELHGDKVPDPYRWMEDPDAKETQEWVEKQNKLTFSLLDGIPYRAQIKERITKMWDYEKRGCPTKHGDSYYYYHNSGLQNQSVLYKQAALDKPGVVFADPNTWSEDGTVSLGSSSFSESGKYWAYTKSTSGSDWRTVHFKNAETGEDMADLVEWVKFSSVTWTHDDQGVFLCKYDKIADDMDKCGTETQAAKCQKLYYHKLGTDQKEDLLVFANPEKENHMYGAQVTHDGKYLIMTISESCAPKNMLWFVPVEAVLNKKEGEDLPFVKLIDEMEWSYSYLTNKDNIWYFSTNENAARKKIIQIDVNKPEKENWKVIIPESENPLSWVSIINKDVLVMVYMVDVKEQLYLYDLEGKLMKDFELPVGTIQSLSGKYKSTEMFYKFVSYLSPGEIWHYDFTTKELKPHYKTVVNGFDSSQFVAKQEFYTSKDGTKIPMFIVHGKDLEKNGQNGCLLYGYGGFNIPLTPSFSIPVLVFLQHFRGVYCVANIRGGSEYGEDWHKGGMCETKQNCFDDFQAAAKYLAEQKYTTAKKTAIQGGSNGGLLVAACVNQAPSLFGAAICQCGVLDMFRFHKFTIGVHWVSDYGNPDVEADYQVCKKYSPVHNINTTEEYPAVLIMTADHDDRVVPLHSLKYAAALQAQAKPSENPLMIRVDTKAGHGAGRPMHKIISDASDYWSFVCNALQLEPKF
eukprot:TRINITY_DN52495_c0_g1_i1.p1 TRINITY_DN52495_c0_g1~~TRINITY_DN52495_c0_g1_i1.p1  ORF type:complete len:701 (+),score=96.47 TRINITY_DN52495_c0_g1_i1:65-2167(+)